MTDQTTVRITAAGLLAWASALLMASCTTPAPAETLVHLEADPHQDVEHRLLHWETDTEYTMTTLAGQDRAVTVPHDDGRVLQYDPDGTWIDTIYGGTKGEFSIRWEPMGGQMTPRMSVFDDAWCVLPWFSDVLLHLASIGSDRSPDAVSAMLLRLGLVDLTPLKD
jgi:hypothetical protein